MTTSFSPAEHSLSPKEACKQILARQLIARQLSGELDALLEELPVPLVALELRRLLNERRAMLHSIRNAEHETEHAAREALQSARELSVRIIEICELKLGGSKP